MVFDPTSGASPGGPSSSDDVPAPGSGIALLPVEPAPAWSGEVRSWSASPAGLVVTCTVVASEDAVQALAGVRVWATARTERTGALAVFQAVAQPSRQDALSLTGVARLALESRRSAVRVPMERDATLVADDTAVPARTVDISRTGCRVSVVGGPDALPSSPVVEVSVELEPGLSVRASAEVVRRIEDDGQLSLRFLDLSTADEQRIDREVLRRLAAATGDVTT